MNIKPLIYNYATRVYLVDDNKAFLQNLQIGLSNEFNCDYETELNQAINKIKNDQIRQIKTFQSLTKPNDNMQHDEDFDNYGSHVAYSLDKIKQMRNQIEKKQDIGVLVIDYDMPEMNGLQFCEQLQGLPIKKIMLTGEADHELAINAFNKKLIDGFVRKGSNQLHQELATMIKQQQQNYFSELQQSVIDGVNSNLTQAGIIDEYNKLVDKLHNQYNITEYYMTDSKGSYLMLDKDGNEHFLQIYSPEELEMYYDIADSSDVSPQMLEAMEQRQRAPLLMHEDKNYLPVDKWAEYMNDITAFQTGDGFYYGFK